MAEGGGERPLMMLAEEFHAMAEKVKNQEDIDVASFSKACSFICPLIESLGTKLMFGMIEYSNKVKEIAEAANSFVALKEMIDQDIQTDTVEDEGSYTRSLLRLNRSLTVLKVLCHEILQSEFVGDFLREACDTTYSQVLAPYHKLTVRDRVAAALMDAIPTWSHIMLKLNEDTNSAKPLMIKYKDSSEIVIEYIDNLFNSKGLGTDW